MALLLRKVCHVTTCRGSCSRRAGWWRCWETNWTGHSSISWRPVWWREVQNISFTRKTRMIILITFLLREPCPHTCVCFGYFLFHKHIYLASGKKKSHNTPTVISNNHMQAVRKCQGKPLTSTRKETKNGNGPLPEKAQQKKINDDEWFWILHWNLRWVKETPLVLAVAGE